MSCVSSVEAMQAHFREHPSCCAEGRAGMCPEGNRLYVVHLSELDDAFARMAQNRESGGSIPGGGLRFLAKALGWERRSEAHPPVLNKSGGSDVEVKMRTYHRVGYYADAPCAECGAAAGEDCR